MFGTTFCQMENSLLMTLTALLLLGVREGTFDNPNITTTTSSTTHVINNTTSTETPCPNITRFITQSVLALLKVDKKGKTCEGQLYLHYLNQSSVPLCNSSSIPDRWRSELCKDIRCGDFKGFKITRTAGGLELSSNMMLINKDCPGLHITCEDTLGSELAAYKAITGILIFVMLGVILVKFCQPTYKAIRKRFSQKRQNRWIGPTQSQSVSYHRGQGPPNNNTLKRQSYPGLERLTVNASREPSSNRNSDYDSYGYN